MFWKIGTCQGHRIKYNTRMIWRGPMLLLKVLNEPTNYLPPCRRWLGTYLILQSVFIFLFQLGICGSAVGVLNLDRQQFLTPWILEGNCAFRRPALRFHHRHRSCFYLYVYYCYGVAKAALKDSENVKGDGYTCEHFGFTRETTFVNSHFHS